MKSTRLFFLFLRDLFGWLCYPNCFNIYEWNDAKGLWCEYFGHKGRCCNFHDVCISDEKEMYKHGFASLEICRRCANPMANPTVQTMPLGRPD